jgi:hypothetical protein
VLNAQSGLSSSSSSSKYLSYNTDTDWSAEMGKVYGTDSTAYDLYASYRD